MNNKKKENWGGSCATFKCPRCGSQNIGKANLGSGARMYVCNDCDYIF